MSTMSSGGVPNQQVWVPDASEGYVIGRIVDVGGGETFSVELSSGKVRFILLIAQ